VSCVNNSHNSINNDSNFSENEKTEKSQLMSETIELEIDSKTDDFADDLIETREFKGKSITVEIASGAILGALSVLIGFMWDLYVEGIMKGPGFAPGMTWFDLLTVPMLVAFFVFGIRSGLIACVIGCGAIIFYPTEAFGWLAMIPKLTASLSMFVVPWVMLKIIGKRREAGNKLRILKTLDYSSAALSPILNYVVVMAVAILFRCIFTFIINLFVVAPLFPYLLYGGEFQTVFTEPELFLTLVGGYTAWNVVQGTSDAIIAYLIVFPTKLNKVFGIW